MKFKKILLYGSPIMLLPIVSLASTCATVKTGEMPEDRGNGIDKTQLNNDAKKVKFSVKNSVTLFASDVKLKDIDTEFENKDKYTVNIEQLLTNTDRRSLIIVYSITEKIKKIKSDSSVTILGGFKYKVITTEELEEEAKKINVDVANKANININEVKKAQVEIKGFKNTEFDVKILNVTKGKDFTSIDVEYELSSIADKSVTLKKVVNVSGFKKIESTSIPRPANVFPTSQPVENKNFDISIISSTTTFDLDTFGAKTYRIPSAIKLRNGEILLSVDKRINGIDDYGMGPIDQVFIRSKDNGATYGEQEEIAKILLPKSGKGLTIDGSFAEVLVDRNKPELGYKLLYFFDVFSGYNGIRHLLSGTPFRKVGDESFWKIWTKNTNNGKLDDTQYVLRKVPNKEGWWRMWQIPEGKTRTDFDVNDIPKLIPTKSYVDTTYHEDTKGITGQAYENVEEADLANPEVLKTKATKHSIFDSNSDKMSKYVVAVNNYNITLESYDNGKTWKNSTVSDQYWRSGNDISPFIGNGVSNGLQLQYQKDKSLNGRIFFQVYSYHGGIHHASYIYSDDNGKTWTEMKVDKKVQTSESTMLETTDGTLWWFFRNPGGPRGSRISKSVDGGKTWINPIDAKSKDIAPLVSSSWNANVFTGLTTFKLNGEDHFVFAAPETKDNSRKNGALYITKDWVNVDKIWQFDTKGVQLFAYSFPITVDVKDNYADIILNYEWTPTRPEHGGITSDKFRITSKSIKIN